MENLETKIEAILFFKGEPVSYKKLESILNSSEEEIIEALSKLRSSLQIRGLRLVEKDKNITLGTAPEYAKIIEDLQKEELSKELSKAALETLSIVLYKNGASRAEIDYIRGVNSSFTLRALSVRGLIEKTVDPKDSRRFLYNPSFDTLSFMGVTHVEELPGWEEVNASVEEAAKSLEEEVKKEEAIAEES